MVGVVLVARLPTLVATMTVVALGSLDQRSCLTRQSSLTRSIAIPAGVCLWDDCDGPRSIMHTSKAGGRRPGRTGCPEIDTIACKYTTHADYAVADDVGRARCPSGRFFVRVCVGGQLPGGSSVPTRHPIPGILVCESYVSWCVAALLHW